MERAEDLRKTRKKLFEEAEEEEREIDGCCRRLESMREACLGTDSEMSGLIERQQELLNSLKEDMREYLDEWEKEHFKGLQVWEAAVLRKKL